MEDEDPPRGRGQSDSEMGRESPSEIIAFQMRSRKTRGVRSYENDTSITSQ